MTEPHIDYERIGRMVDERIREKLHGNGDTDTQVRLREVERIAGTAWTTVTDLTRTIDKGFEGVSTHFEEVKARLDKTNGHIAALHTWRDRTLGALSVLALLVTTFGATVVVLVATK